MEVPVVEKVRAIAAAAVAQIEQAACAEELEKLRIRLLGKKGEITQLSRLLGQLPAEERPVVGEAVNNVKKLVQGKLAERAERLQTKEKARPKTWIDVTLPGIRREAGHRHPLLRTMEELKTVLLGMGYRYDDYPEIEQEWFNFDSLCTPPWHPSRDMHDSFYTEQGNVMRTHTSAFQVRAMRELGEPPIRAMTSGRCYRRDQIDATHFPVFHQLDVIAIDRQTSFADLKWTLFQMLTSLLGAGISLRFRPSYFPFTTPSAEVDVYYGGRWLELLGSGMIRPEVLSNGGLDPHEWRGFAFGIGIDRLAMARFHIDDIRLLYENEAAFLSQF